MLNRQISAAIRETVDQVLAEDGFRRYTGQNCERLTGELSQRFSASEVLLCSSGTAALETVLRAAGIGKGDEVLLSGYDYPGNFWAIERVGARPLLCDVQAGSWRVDPAQLAQAWEDAPAPALKAVVVSHLHGQLQDMLAIRDWCEQHGLILIEDACQAVGASLAGKAVGSLGHASILSFGGGKVMSSGRGGALLTSDSALGQRARVCAGAGSGPYALSELQAAVVVAQLPWLQAINQHCRQFFTELSEGLHNQLSIICPYSDDLQQTSFYQAGFLSQGPTAAIERLIAAGFLAGRGFAGFHRRSGRRCRCWQPLLNVPQIAETTLTIHYSSALNPRLSAQQAVTLLKQPSSTTS